MAKYDGTITLQTKVDTSGITNSTEELTKSTKKLASAGTLAANAFAALGIAAAGAAVKIVKSATTVYADFEQLVGGVETLFKQSSDKIVEYANQAFYTAGMSANYYMQTVTSFSASLLNSLGYDTEKAADIANQAIIDISDNANKMGTSIDTVAIAFQSFARQQYVLLDNLKLGYGGTKNEMERLLRDAEAYLASQGKTAKFSINNLADVYTAINAIQQKLNITGTTMKEAEETITGSLSMVKASWTNLLSAMSGGGDLDRAVNNLLYSIEKFANNIMPVLTRALSRLGLMIQNISPTFGRMIADTVINMLPSILIAIQNLIVGMLKGIVNGISGFFSTEQMKPLEIIKNETSQTAKNIEAQVAAQNELNKATKKSIAGFDELNILSSSTAETELANTSFTSDVSSMAIELEQTDQSMEDLVTWTDIFTGKAGKLSKILAIVASVMSGGAFQIIAGILLIKRNWADIKTWFISNIVNPFKNWVDKYIWQPLQKFGGLLNKYIFTPVLAIIAPIILKIEEIRLKIWEILKALGKAWYTYAWKPFYSTVIEPIKHVFATAANWMFNNVIMPIWDKIKWLKEAITGVFRSIGVTIASFVSNALEKTVNAVLARIESTINGFIRMLNSSIDLINKIPGVNISKVSELNIPRIATGNTLPANEAYYSSGSIALGSGATTAPIGQTIGGTTEIPLIIDGREFGRAVLTQGSIESNRLNGRMVLA